MDAKIHVLLLDIMNAIKELDEFFINYPRDYNLFEKDLLRRRAVERNTEIMGEAINRILKIDPNFIIPNGKDVVKTRNRIIHGYDSVKPEFLWSLVMIHIPKLKQDIKRLLEDGQ